MSRVAFIGLGVMGKPMARHLLTAGFELRVHNRSPEPVDELAREGATALDDPAEAHDCDYVITMLPDTVDVESVAGKLVPAMAERSIWIDMSTIRLDVASELAERVCAGGADFLDAPVSGGEVGAEEARLSIMVGGEEAAVLRARPILETLGRNVVHVGPAGSGQLVKACNQVMVGAQMQGMAEAVVLGAKAGVEPAKIVEVLSAGLARCGALETRGPQAIRGDFSPGARARLHAKDLRIALDTAQRFGLPMPCTALIHELFGVMVATGRGDLDHSGLMDLIAEWADVSFSDGGGGPT